MQVWGGVEEDDGKEQDQKNIPQYIEHIPDKWEWGWGGGYEEIEASEKESVKLREGER